MRDFLSLPAARVEQHVFQNRVLVCVVAMVVAIVLLVVRLTYLQIVGHEHYAMLSRDNQVKISPLAPNRGLIYDRNGEVLADNIPTYSLEIVPEQTPNLTQTLADLKALLNLSEEELQRFDAQRRRRKPFERVPLRLQLSEEEIARFAVKMPYFPGVEVRSNMVRTYPYGALTAHVVGYVGRISEADMQTLDQAAYSGTNHIGKSGLEKSYEAVLHGKTGYEEVETNVQGRPLQVLGATEPIAGRDIILSLDLRLQKIAYEALGEYNGAVVAIEPESGRVLVMASKPSFDPNPFVNGIRRADYNALQSSPDRPLYDRALRGIYPPGSTIKPFVAMAGLVVGDVNPARREQCPGFFSLPGSAHRYRDWRKGGHGPVDLKYAITQSCDVYFYKLALKIGIERLHGFMTRFGFGEPTGIDLGGEKRGLYPSPEWKERTRKQPWFKGETVIAGIGQGYVQVTPLQLARATAIMANRGAVIVPHLVDWLRVGGQSEPPQSESAAGLIKAEHAAWKTVIDAMIDVVHSGYGTAQRIAYGLPYRIAGKTGTAQVFSIRQDQRYRESSVQKKLRDHALFIAFAPALQPKIAVAVIAENGGHGGSTAAPIARAVINQYLMGAP